MFVLEWIMEIETQKYNYFSILIRQLISNIEAQYINISHRRSYKCDGNVSI